MSAGDTVAQVQDEIQHLVHNKDLSDEIITGCQVNVTPETAVAMKANLGLSWSKMQSLSKLVIHVHACTCDKKSKITLRNLS